MKKLVFSLSTILICVSAQAQITKYRTSNSEIGLSYALIDDINDGNVIPRFSYWFNFQEAYNFDFGGTFGLFAGFSVRNVGFIVNYNDSMQTKKKYRTYNLGIPLGFKIGNLAADDKFYFFAGGEIEFPLHFKEKTFYNDKKQFKYGEWISERTNLLQPSVFLGVNFPSQWSIKLKYYFMDYMNAGYDYYVGTLPTHPYANFLKTNIICISFGKTIQHKI